MYSDQIGLAILGFIIISAFYGWYEAYRKVKKYFIKRKRESDRIIGRYDE